MRSVFFSDVHARGSAEEAGASIPGFLRSVGGGLDHLFVVGDLFDFWFSREGVVYPGFRPIIDALTALQRSGVQVHLFEGNHDFFLADYFTRHHGIEVYTEEARFTLGGRTVYIAHGDLVDESDRGYRFLRRLLRSPLFYGLQKRLPLAMLWKLARRSSDASKTYLAKPQGGLAAKMESFALAKFSEGIDAVVLGHCHLPVHRTCTVDGRQRDFALLGDWLEHRSYLNLEDGRFELRFWGEQTGGSC
jgi:UDP-2,3-diacylglucosamine hydrolase